MLTYVKPELPNLWRKFWNWDNRTETGELANEFLFWINAHQSAPSIVLNNWKFVKMKNGINFFFIFWMTQLLVVSMFHCSKATHMQFDIRLLSIAIISTCFQFQAFWIVYAVLVYELDGMVNVWQTREFVEFKRQSNRIYRIWNRIIVIGFTGFGFGLWVTNTEIAFICLVNPLSLSVSLSPIYIFRFEISKKSCFDINGMVTFGSNFK